MTARNVPQWQQVNSFQVVIPWSDLFSNKRQPWSFTAQEIGNVWQCVCKFKVTGQIGRGDDTEIECDSTSPLNQEDRETWDERPASVLWIRHWAHKVGRFQKYESGWQTRSLAALGLWATGKRREGSSGTVVHPPPWLTALGLPVGEASWSAHDVA